MAHLTTDNRETEYLWSLVESIRDRPEGVDVELALQAMARAIVTLRDEIREAVRRLDYQDDRDREATERR
jgi:hypothetical protein